MSKTGLLAAIASFAVLPLVACTSEQPRPQIAPDRDTPRAKAPLPEGAPVVGESCTPEGASTCAPTTSEGPSTVICTDGLWALLNPCTRACADAGECMVGCAVQTTAAAPFCLCAPMGPNCPGSVHCKSHHALNIPDADGNYTTLECAEECDDGPNSFTLGCVFSPEQGDASCSCAALGISCQAGDTGRACVGAPVEATGDARSATLEIATCDNGIWSALSCAELCDDPNAQCWRSNDKDAPDACSCEY
ncbi:MAG TPA: hypothetical protein ENJ18_10245 [Nannocystis exedens]|nr:hypothetical protein [Nannocystis exedens]